MQNHSNSRIFQILVQPLRNRPLTGRETNETKPWQFPLDEIAIESSKCTEMYDKSL